MNKFMLLMVSATAVTLLGVVDFSDCIFAVVL